MVEIKVRKPDGTEGVISADSEEEAQAKLARAKELHTGLEVVEGTSDPMQVTAEPMVSTGSGALDTAYDFARGMGRGVTFDWADEMAGALSSGMLNLTHSDDELAAMEEAGIDTSYEGARDRIRRDQDMSELRSEHATLAGELTGGFAVPGAGVFKGAQALTKALPAVKPTTGLALGGAGAGGLAAAGASQEQTLSGIAQDAALGAGVGAVAAPVLGGALSYLGTNVGRVGQGMLNRFAADPDLAARMRVRQALEYSGMDDPAKVKLMQEEMGPEGALADMSAPLMQEAQLVAKQPGAGSQMANDFVEQRLKGSAERLNRAARDGLGAHQYGSWGDDYYKFMDDLDAGRKAQAGPLYEQAYTVDIEPTPGMTQLLNTPVFQRAMKRAMGNVRNKLESYGPPRPPMQPDGKFTTQHADQTLRELSDMESSAIRAGRREFARDVGNIRRQFAQEVYKQNPAFQQARGVWAGSKQLEDAATMGRELLGGNKTFAEDVERLLGDYTEGERDAFTIGLIRGIQDKVASTPDTGDVGRRLFGSRRIQEVLEEAFGDADFDSFYNAVKLESRFQQTRNKVVGGSPTAPLRFAEEQGRPMEATAGAEFGPWAWAASLLRRMVNETVEDASKLGPEDYERMAGYLFGDLDDATVRRIFTSSFGGRMAAREGDAWVSPALGVSGAEQLGAGAPVLLQ